jgi:hypothetical protein
LRRGSFIGDVFHELSTFLAHYQTYPTAASMSAFGTKRTSDYWLAMSAFGGKADIDETPLLPLLTQSGHPATPSIQVLPFANVVAPSSIRTHGWAELVQI